MVVCAVSIPVREAGGYDPTSRVRRSIRSEIMRAMASMRISKGIAGMGLGPETDFAELCLELKVPFIAAVAFDGLDHGWPAPSRKRYWDLLDKAEDVVFVCGRGFAPWKLRKRNEWMLARSEGVIAVSNDQPGFTADCIKEARTKNLQVEIINPGS